MNSRVRFSRFPTDGPLFFIGIGVSNEWIFSFRLFEQIFLLSMKFASITAATLLSVSYLVVNAEENKAGPPFFLIDTSDQLCLAGEEFKRCSIDTLWYVQGTAGKL